MKDKNILTIDKILKYSNQINQAIIDLELDYNKFINNYIAQNSISMCLIAIGGLVNSLTDEFKSKYNQLQWRDIIGMRNRVAHDYFNIDLDIVWDIADKHNPILNKYLNKILNELTDKESNQ